MLFLVRVCTGCDAVNVASSGRCSRCSRNIQAEPLVSLAALAEERSQPQLHPDGPGLGRPDDPSTAGGTVRGRTGTTPP